MSYGSEWYVVEPREIGALDRIGGGYGFVGGLLYEILKEVTGKVDTVWVGMQYLGSDTTHRLCTAT